MLKKNNIILILIIIMFFLFFLLLSLKNNNFEYFDNNITTTPYNITTTPYNILSTEDNIPIKIILPKKIIKKYKPINEKKNEPIIQPINKRKKIIKKKIEITNQEITPNKIKKKTILKKTNKNIVNKIPVFIKKNGEKDLNTPIYRDKYKKYNRMVTTFFIKDPSLYYFILRGLDGYNIYYKPTNNTYIKRLETILSKDNLEKYFNKKNSDLLNLKNNIITYINNSSKYSIEKIRLDIWNIDVNFSLLIKDSLYKLKKFNKDVKKEEYIKVINKYFNKTYLKERTRIINNKIKDDYSKLISVLKEL
jgi:hypothetical protein